MSMKNEMRQFIWRQYVSAKRSIKRRMALFMCFCMLFSQLQISAVWAGRNTSVASSLNEMVSSVSDSAMQAKQIKAQSGTTSDMVLDGEVENNIASLNDADINVMDHELSETVDGTVIKVKYDNGVFPEDVTLSVKKLDADKDGEKIEKIDNRILKEATADGESREIYNAKAFDIKIMDFTGMEVQPDTTKGQVYVSFVDPEITNTEALDEKVLSENGKKDPNPVLQVYHLDENLEAAKNLNPISENSTDEVEVQANHFSVYVICAVSENAKYSLTSSINDGITVPLENVLNNLSGRFAYLEHFDTNLGDSILKEGTSVVSGTDIISYDQSTNTITPLNTGFATMDVAYKVMNGEYSVTRTVRISFAVYLLSSSAKSGSCGDSATWSVNEAGTELTINGTGAMSDYNLGDLEGNIAPWYEYSESLKKITISDGITKIGNYSFYGLKNVSDVTLPASSLLEIGYHAFHGSGLTQVSLPDSIQKMGYGVFESTDLTSVTLPARLTAISPILFAACYQLTSVTIPDSVTVIGYNAFWSCPLTALSIPDSVNEIAEDAFYGCNELGNITIPASVATLSDAAFYKTEMAKSGNKNTLTQETGSMVHIYKNNHYNPVYTDCATGIEQGTISDKPVIVENGIEIISTSYDSAVMKVKAEKATNGADLYRCYHYVSTDSNAPVDTKRLTDAYESVTYYSGSDSWDSINIGEGRLDPGTQYYVYAVAEDTNGNYSEIRSTGFKTLEGEKCAAPVFTPDGGTFKGSVTFELTCATQGATIRYTTDGYMPVETSAKYNAAVTVTKPAIVNAVAFKEGMAASAVVTAFYAVVPDNTITEGAVTLSQDIYYASGNHEAFTPAVTVLCNGNILRQDTDYTVAYADNTEPGKAVAVIKGMGDYSGIVNKYFTIREAYTVKFNFSEETINGASEYSVSVNPGQVLYAIPLNPGNLSDAGKRLKCWKDALGEEIAPYGFIPQGDCTLTAEWEEVYKISFFYSGQMVYGATSSNVYVVRGKPIANLQPFGIGFVNDGNKYLKGWKDDAGNEIKNIYSYIPASDMTVSAIWSDTYKVTINFGDQTIHGVSEGYAYAERGKAVSQSSVYKGELSDIKRIITGWKTPDSTVIDDIYSYIPESDVTITALWSATYCVTLDYNGEKIGNLSGSALYAAQGSPVSMVTGFIGNRSDSNKVLSGWTDSLGNRISELSGYVPASDITLKAVWSDGYKITLDFNGQTLNGATCSDVYVATGSAFLNGSYYVGRASDQGKVLKCWTDGNGNIKDNLNGYVPVSDMKFTASWNDAYKVTMDFSGQTINGLTQAVAYSVQGSAVFNIPYGTGSASDEHKVLTGWKDRDGNLIKNIYTFIPDADTIVFAVWTDTYKIEFDFGGETYNGKTQVLNYIIPGSIIANNPLSENAESQNGKYFSYWKDAEGNIYLPSTISSEIPTGSRVFTAQWVSSADMVTILYKSDAGASATSSDTVVKGTTVGTGAYAGPYDGTRFAKDGYVLTSWKIEGNGQSILSEFEPTEDVTLVAQWEPGYKVGFDLKNGVNEWNGDTEMEPYYVKQGDTLNLFHNYYAGELFKDDSYFIGWDENSDGSGKVYTYEDANTDFTPVKDTTFYAIWGNKVQVSFDANGGLFPQNGASSAAGEAYYGKSPSQCKELYPDEPIRAGYAFDGWYLDSTGNTVLTDTYQFHDKVTLYANWTTDCYKETFHFGSFTFKDNLNQGISAATAVRYIKKGRKTYNINLEQAFFSASNFKWYLDSNSLAAYSTDMIPDSDLDIYAGKEIPYSVEYSRWYGNGGKDFKGRYSGQISIYADGSGTYHMEGLPDGLTRADYSFDGWYTAAEGGSKLNISDLYQTRRDIFAHWSAEFVTVTLDPDGGTLNCAASVNVKPGSPVGYLYAPVKAGYAFVGWSCENKMIPDITGWTPSANTTIKAVWTDNMAALSFHVPDGYTLWNAYNDRSAETGEDNHIVRYRIPVGQKLYTDSYALTVENSALPAFIGWSLSEQSTDTVNIAERTFSGDTDLYPVLADSSASYQITLELLGGQINDAAVGAALDTATVYVRKGNLLDTPEDTKMYRSSYVFSGWYDNSSFAGTPVYIPATGFKPLKDMILYAKWSTALQESDFADIAVQSYTGAQIKPAVTALTGLSEGTDYEISYGENVNAGSGTVTIKGINNYSGSVVKTFAVLKADISDATVTFNRIYTFTGSEIVPSKDDLTVLLGSGQLSKEEYDITACSNNVAAGTSAVITISGKGNYQGTVNAYFSINQNPAYNLADATISLAAPNTMHYYAYGEAVDPGIIVTDQQGQALTAGNDYTAEYKNDTTAGAATVKITGIAPYENSSTFTYEIRPLTLNASDISLSGSFAYTGESVRPMVAVKSGNMVLKEGTDRDYTVTYGVNTEPGEGTVTINGVHNYTGTVIKTFNIVRNNLSEAVITINGADAFVYDGTEKVPQSVEVTLGGKRLTETEDYVLTYSNNLDAGTALVTVTGQGDYTGTITGRYTIKQAEPRYQMPGSLTAVYGSVLCSILLPGGFSWSTPDALVGAVGTNVFSASYVPQDQKNYKTVSGISIPVLVTGKNLVDTDFTITGTSFPYTGQEIKPAVTTVQGILSADYSVSYTDNVNVGTTAKAIITGIGSCQGTVTKNFEITRAVPKITVKAGNNITIKEGTTSFDLGVTTDSLNALTYTVNDPAIVSVSNAGIVKALKIGTTAVTVSCAGDSNHEAVNAVININVVINDIIKPSVAISPAGMSYGMVGDNLSFSGEGSTDNDSIASYSWDFGDGTIGSGMQLTHAYQAAGTYTVTLSAADPSGNIGTGTTLVKIVGDDMLGAGYTKANLTVCDAVSLSQILGAEITFTSDSFNMVLKTDSTGHLMCVIPSGKYTVGVTAEGYLPRSVQITFSEKSQENTVGLSDGDALTGDMHVTELTYDEILTAGINPSAPENEHVYKFVTVLEFHVGLKTYYIPATLYKDKNYKIIADAGTSEDREPGKITDKGGYVDCDGTEIGIFPSENFFLIIYGQAHWLKEMFRVELLLTNRSKTDAMEGVEATLNLPSGVSFAAMSTGQQEAVQKLGNIGESESATATWYIKGDEKGDYNLSAQVDAYQQSYRDPITETFSTKNPFHVYAGSALHLTIIADDVAEKGTPYHVIYRLTNVSEKPVYNLEFGIRSDKEYRALSFHHSTAEDLGGMNYGDAVTRKVALLAPGDYIEYVVETKVLFSSYLEFLKNIPDLGDYVDLSYYLQNITVSTMAGSTTDIPYDYQINETLKTNIIDKIVSVCWKQAVGITTGTVIKVWKEVAKVYLDKFTEQFLNNKIGEFYDLKPREKDCKVTVSIGGTEGEMSNEVVELANNPDGSCRIKAKGAGSTNIVLKSTDANGISAEQLITLSVNNETWDTKQDLSSSGKDQNGNSLYNMDQGTFQSVAGSMHDEEQKTATENPFKGISPTLSLNLNGGYIENSLSGSGYSLTLPEGAVKNLLDNTVLTDMNLNNDTASVSFDREALSVVEANTNGNLEIGVRRLSSSEAINLGTTWTTYQLTMKSNGKSITDFGSGTVTVRVPYTFVAGELAQDIYIEHLKEDGTIEKLPAEYDEEHGMLTFTTQSWSYFRIAGKNRSIAPANTSSGNSSFGGGNNGSKSGTPDKEGITSIDETKGHVNTVKGIITGEESGYSKWVQDSKGWKLIYANGKTAAGKIVKQNETTGAAGTEDGTEVLLWEKINNSWFAFGSDGYIKTGWFHDNVLNADFYIDVNKGMLTGWQFLDGNWFFMKPDGALETGWVELNGDWYFCNPDRNDRSRPYGAMYRSGQTPDSYEVDENGKRIG